MTSRSFIVIKMMKMKFRSIGVIVTCAFLSATLFFSCDSSVGSKTRKENYDSLFLGFHFGMDRKEFFQYCSEMNQKKLFAHGTGATSVQYELKDEFKAPVIMRFYPSFHDEKIYEMPVTFTYEAWAPWNKQYWSDVLLEEMYEQFKVWYGDGFQVVNHPNQGKIYAKIDGRRRINLFIRDDQFVQAVFSDMKVVTELEKQEEN